MVTPMVTEGGTLAAGAGGLESLNDQVVGVYRLRIEASGRTRHAGQQDFTFVD